MSQKTALITGASSGIGYELSKLFEKNGYNTVIVSRNEEKLSALAYEINKEYKVETKIISKDLSHPNSANEIFNEIGKQELQIDVLVNNAGFDVYGEFSNTNLEEEMEMMQVNMVSLTKLTKLFLPKMKTNSSGKILNISSIGAFVPGPLNIVYCATKAYVLNFSEGLAEELDGTGVTVTALCPGATKTEFTKRAKNQDIKFFKSHVMEAKQVAQIGYDGLMKNKRVVVPGLYNKTQHFLIKLLPRKRVAKITKHMMSK
ncbi:MAG: SDR family oxidoreductase [Candidatus Bathyarchaeota archaeon]|nr:SDR family oxidoreductase [Candidatus Bathyarchaeota archaeon]